ncbi:MAG: hypothetical protein ACC618_03010 [Patescibacteria group bacterium]
MEGENQIVPEHEEKFRKIEATLTILSKRLDNEKVNYYIIGSLARNIYMGDDPQSPEIDLVIPNPNDQDKMAQIISDEIQPAHPDIYIDTSLSDYIQETDGEYILTYGNIEHKVDSELMEPQELIFQSAKFKSFAPPTLLHAYTFVGGPFRSKDWTSALTFARWMRKENIEYDHDKFSGFHKFGKEKWNNSPLRKSQHAWRKFVNDLPKDFRDKLLDVYKLPIAKQARRLFNQVEEMTCGTN